MSFHNSPKYQIPELIADLKSCGLENNKPSQLSDAFRTGWLAAWNRRAAQPVSAGLTDEQIIELHDSMFPRIVFEGDKIGRNIVKFSRALLSAAQRDSQPVADTSADARDAARWRAVLGSARVRPLGSAGLESELNPYGEPWNGYAHLGLELWTVFGSSLNDDQRERLVKENALGREWLTKYADAAIAASREES